MLTDSSGGSGPLQSPSSLGRLQTRRTTGSERSSERLTNSLLAKFCSLLGAARAGQRWRPKLDFQGFVYTQQPPTTTYYLTKTTDMMLQTEQISQRMLFYKSVDLEWCANASASQKTSRYIMTHMYLGPLNHRTTNQPASDNYTIFLRIEVLIHRTTAQGRSNASLVSQVLWNTGTRRPPKVASSNPTWIATVVLPSEPHNDTVKGRLYR